MDIPDKLGRDRFILRTSHDIPDRDWCAAAAKHEPSPEFRNCRKIDSGSFGTVFLGWDEDLSIPVAIKIVRDQGTNLANDALENLAKEFEVEARRIAQLSQWSASIVSIYGQGVHEPGRLPWIAMEYLGGGTLRRRMLDAIERKQLLPPETALNYLTGAAHALDRAHQRNVVHLDVKPENMLLDRDDEDGWLHLTDFGIARLLDQTLTPKQAELIRGTPRYMAPEACSGLGHVNSGVADQYALGLIAYELFTGRNALEAPGERLGHMQWLAAHTNRRLQPFPAGVTLPPGLHDILSRAAAKKPEDRYSSCRAFVDELRAVWGLGTGAIHNQLNQLGTSISGLPTIVSLAVHSSFEARDHLRSQVEDLTRGLGAAEAKLDIAETQLQEEKASVSRLRSHRRLSFALNAVFLIALALLAQALAR